MRSFRTDNVIQVSDDLHVLKKKGIKSPDTDKMKYHIFDKAQHAKYYFHTKEKYLKMYQKLLASGSTPGNLIVSHPEFFQNHKHTRPL